MESFATLIRNRRSTRLFTDQPLEPEQVEEILRAALMAPSSKRKNPWQFVVVEDKEMLERLAECKPHGAEFLKGCALAVVVLADVMISDVWIEDASIASIYMQLQAEDLGLGSCWCQVRNREREDESGAGEYIRQLLDIPYQLEVDESGAGEYIRQLLDIPYQLEVLSIIGFGHKAQERKPFDESRLQWEKVHIDRFTMPEPDNDKEEMA